MPLTSPLLSEFLSFSTVKIIILNSEVCCELEIEADFFFDMENAILLGTDLNNHIIQVDASMEKKWYQCEAKMVLRILAFSSETGYSNISLRVIVIIK